MNRVSWRTKAACKNLDPAPFFPSDLDPGLEAKRVCETCEVKKSCLEFALQHEEFGVWGGTTHRERRNIRRKQRRTRTSQLPSSGTA